MNMKKSLVAVAVAGGLGFPFVAAADAEVYGSVRVAVQNVNDDGVAMYGQDEGFGLFSPSSRLGFRGEEDIGGLTAFGHYEFGIDATTMTNQPGNRLSYVGLRGDFGEIQGGRIWGSWYEYIGWTTDRSWFWGGTGYYGYGSGLTFTDAAGDDVTFGGLNVGATTRSSDTVKYTWGSGGYGSDPFTFSLEAVMDGTSAGTEAEGAVLGQTAGGSDIEADPQAFDIFTAGAQGTFGDFTVGGAHRVTSSNTDPTGPEPSQTAVSFRWDPSAPFYLGAIYTATDRDNDSSFDSPQMFEVLGTMDFGGGLSGQLGLSSLDNDAPGDVGDTTGVFAQLNQALSNRTNLFIEGQVLSVDGGDTGFLDASGDPIEFDDTDPRLVMIGMEHSF